MPPDSPSGTPPLDDSDRRRLEHIARSAIDARTIVGGDDALTIARDMVRARALVNCFTEIGEAAAKLSKPGRDHVGSLPWRKMVGMRNIVVHVYWGIDLVELVKTTRDDLTPLIQAIQSALD
jgi:uncharacterized protein with HEPN domain